MSSRLARSSLAALALTAWLCVSLGPGADAAEPLLYGKFLPAPHQTMDDRGLLDRLLKELFRRQDMELVSADVGAAARAFDLGKRGLIDLGVGSPHGIPFAKHAVVLREALTTAEIVAVSATVKTLPDGWASLTRHRVAYPRGWRLVEAEIRKGENVYTVSRSRQLFEMLAAGRVDIVLAERLIARMQLKALSIEDAKIIEPPLIRTDLLAFLLKKHAPLVPDLEATLRAMKADGTHRLIHEEAMRDFGLD